MIFPLPTDAARFLMQVHTSSCIYVRIQIYIFENWLSSCNHSFITGYSKNKVTISSSLSNSQYPLELKIPLSFLTDVELLKDHHTSSIDQQNEI